MTEEAAPAGTIADDPPQGRFSAAFAQGLVLVFFFYACLAGWLWLERDKTAASRQERLSEKTVIVERSVSADEGDFDFGFDDDEGEDGYADPSAGAAQADAGMVEAPVEGLLEETPMGNIPVIRKDGLTAFKAYRRPFDRAAAGNRPVVSVVIAGVGISERASETAIQSMPPDVTFAVSPYAASPDFWVKEARARGHEIWLTLPVETGDYPQSDPGPHTLMIGVPERDNMTKMAWLFSRATGYAGFIAVKNAAFMNSVQDMRPAVGAIYGRGLAFADTAEETNAVPATMAHGMNAPYAAIDVWIDETATQDDILRALDVLEKKAREQGAAAGVIHPLPVSYQEVEKWVATLPGKGIVLAPLSAQTGL